MAFWEIIIFGLLGAGLVWICIRSDAGMLVDLISDLLDLVIDILSSWDHHK